SKQLQYGSNTIVIVIFNRFGQRKAALEDCRCPVVNWSVEPFIQRISILGLRLLQKEWNCVCANLPNRDRGLWAICRVELIKPVAQGLALIDRIACPHDEPARRDDADLTKQQTGRPDCDG